MMKWKQANKHKKERSIWLNWKKYLYALGGEAIRAKWLWVCSRVLPLRQKWPNFFFYFYYMRFVWHGKELIICEMCIQFAVFDSIRSSGRDHDTASVDVAMSSISPRHTNVMSSTCHFGDVRAVSCQIYCISDDESNQQQQQQQQFNSFGAFGQKYSIFVTRTNPMLRS